MPHSAKITPEVTSPVPQPVILWLTGYTGAGKTWLGDYFERVQNFIHVDGDKFFLDQDPESQKLMKSVQRAFYSYWMQRRPAPEALWHPYFTKLCDAVNAARAANPNRNIICTFSTYPRVARDFVRDHVPGVNFVLLSVPDDVVLYRLARRNEKAAKAFGQDVEAFTRTALRKGAEDFPVLNDALAADPFDWEVAINQYFRLMLAGFEPAGTPATSYCENADAVARETGVSPTKAALDRGGLVPEPATYTVDASDEGRGPDLCGVARALHGLVGLGEVIPLDVGVDADGHVTLVEDVTSPTGMTPTLPATVSEAARTEALKLMVEAISRINYARWDRLVADMAAAADVTAAAARAAAEAEGTAEGEHASESEEAPSPSCEKVVEEAE